MLYFLWHVIPIACALMFKRQEREQENVSKLVKSKLLSVIPKCVLYHQLLVVKSTSAKHA